MPSIRNLDWTVREASPYTGKMEQVALLHKVSSIVSSDLDLEKMLEELVSLAFQATKCDACLVYLVEHSSGEIVLRASQLPHAAEIGKIRLQIGEGRRPLPVDDVADA